MEIDLFEQNSPWEKYNISKEHYLDSEERWERVIELYYKDPETFEKKIREEYINTKDKEVYS